MLKLLFPLMNMSRLCLICYFNLALLTCRVTKYGYGTCTCKMISYQCNMEILEGSKVEGIISLPEIIVPSELLYWSGTGLK